MNMRSQFTILVLTFLLIGAVATALSVGFGDAKIPKLLIETHIVWLGVLVGEQIAAYLAYTLAYGALFQLKIDQAARRTLYGFSPLAPFGGFVYDAETVKQKRLHHRVAALSIIEYALLAPAVLAAAIIALVNGADVPKGLTIPWIVGVPAGTIFAILLVLNREKLGKVRLVLDGLLNEFSGLTFFSWFFVLAGIGAYWTAEIASLDAALHLFGVNLSALTALIIAYATGYVLTRRSLPTALAGATIILMILSLHWVGLSYAPALDATYVYLIVNIILPIIYLAARKLFPQSA